jgi:hypothetical protein
MTNLGKLKRLDPREVWPHEAHNFTPWLAERIDMLGEALGMDLEHVESEASVGSFSVDIVARDLGQDRVVVIENQLEATDHSHLGQLITYAAGMEAEVVIWISREFREEHRQALDWLNRGHGVGTDFFGVVLELLKIDDSKPAPNFRVIASPNEWVRSSPKKGASDGPITDKQSRYQQFFQRLIDQLRTKHKFTNAKAGQPQNWYAFSTGSTGFSYGLNFALGGRLRAELYIDFQDADKNRAIFDKLKAEAPKYDVMFGEPLEWEALENKRACRVGVYRKGSITDSDEEQEQYLAWSVTNLLTMKKAFGPHLSSLKG